MRPIRRSIGVWVTCLVLLGVVAPAAAQTAAPVTYRVTFPEPEHHWVQIEARFPAVGVAPLDVRMSRSSPGRYSVHEFAKNIFSLTAYDGAGRELTTTRPDADVWRISGHDGTVRVVYRLFGDYADGTYMAVDTTHAHLNMPATFLWAVGLDDRPIDLTFVPPADSGWTVGTQLFPTSDPFRFTAPNLQYFMDSPTELAQLLTSTFDVANADGSASHFRLMVHTMDRQADVDALAALARRLVIEERAVFGEFPRYEPGRYTFLLDLVPWVYSDAMEHRNSTYISAPYVLRTPEGRADVIEMMAHEYFHNWNVERIRPAGLEPFDFTRENVTCCLWLAEGFTQDDGDLLRVRAGLAGTAPVGYAQDLMLSAGRRVRSAVGMSEHAPFADAAVANDIDDQNRSFLSYYSDGAAIALGLDLTLRERSSGRVSLDDFLRRLWQEFGAPADPRPGYVARPYTLRDLRRVLAEVSGDAAFADTFFTRYVEGRDVLDYAHLLSTVGYALTPGPSRAWPGDIALFEDRGGLTVGAAQGSRRETLVPFDSPAYAAGLDAGDRIVSIDGRPATMAAWRGLAQRRPGDQIALVVERRDGRRQSTALTLGTDPRSASTATLAAAPTAAERAARQAWLGSHVSDQSNPAAPAR